MIFIKPEFKKKLIKELRNPANKQCRGLLSTEPGVYCALGLLGKILGYTDEELINFNCNTTDFYSEIAKKGGLKSPSSLYFMNDGGASFSEIADILESEKN